MCENLSLWCSYQAILFKADQQPVYPCFAILTAFNPGSIALNNCVNLNRNALLEIDLRELTDCILPVTSSARDGSWQEAGFAVAISLEQACRLARKWQQNAIYWVEDGQLMLVPVLMENVMIMKLGEMKDFFYTE